MQPHLHSLSHLGGEALVHAIGRRLKASANLSDCRFFELPAHRADASSAFKGSAHLRLGCPRGFTLLELSVVLALIAVIFGGGLLTLTAYTQSASVNATVARMDAIEKALLNFAIANNRIPCPSDLSIKPGAATCGVEAATERDLPWRNATGHVPGDQRHRRGRRADTRAATARRLYG